MKTGMPLKRPDEQHAFTVIDLLTVICIFAIFTMLIFPALGRTNTSSTAAQCLNNLQQLSTGVAMYAVDNRDTLPGPCWTGVYGHYDTTSQVRFALVKYVARYLGGKAPTATMQRLSVADCPGSLRFRRNPVSSTNQLATNVSYQAVNFITNNLTAGPLSVCNAPVQDRFPFGYPSSICGSAGEYPGMKISNIKFPVRQWALSDSDALNTVSSTNVSVGGSNYGQNLPPRRVHLDSRNYLFFDGRAETIRD